MRVRLKSFSYHSLRLGLRFERGKRSVIGSPGRCAAEVAIGHALAERSGNRCENGSPRRDWGTRIAKTPARRGVGGEDGGGDGSRVRQLVRSVDRSDQAIASPVRGGRAGGPVGMATGVVGVHPSLHRAIRHHGRIGRAGHLPDRGNIRHQKGECSEAPDKPGKSRHLPLF